MSSIARVRATAVGVALGLYVALPAFSEPLDLSRIFPGALIGDFNGDGTPDALVQPPSRLRDGAVYLGERDRAPRAAAQDLPPQFLGLPIDATRADLHLGDFDGDGRDDLFVQPFALDGTHAIYTSNARGELAGLSDAFDARHLGFDWSASRIVVGDYDGDGRDEIVLQGLPTETPVATLTTNLNGEIEAGIQQWQDGFLGRHWNGRAVRLHSGDFDGDGREDLLLQVKDRALTRAPYHESDYAVALARDGGLFKAIDQTWDRDAFGADWDPNKFDLQLGDFNGDGITDFALMARAANGTHTLVLGGEGGRPAGVVARWRGGASPAEALGLATASFAAEVTAKNAGLETAPEAKPNAPMRQQATLASGTAAVGAVAGEAGVSGGAASYRIPIVVPPGRAGVQPQVSIGYSSRGGGGELGVGWSLGAGSAIARCPQTLAQDGRNLSVRYSATEDRLCLDGQRLVNVSGAYGASGTHYRTEIDSKVLVTQSGGINTAGSTFTVRSNDGSVSYYGSGNATFIAEGLTTPLSWQISRSEDTSGNSVIYTYDNSVAGEQLLSQIQYTGRGTTAGDRKVTFTWEARPNADLGVSYLVGGKTRATRRLAQIKTFVGAATVRQYTFQYHQSGATRRSLLDAVQECAYSGATLHCLPATTLNWAEDAPVLGVPDQVPEGLRSNDNNAWRLSFPGETAPVPIRYYEGQQNTPQPPLYTVRPGSSLIGRGQRDVAWQSNYNGVRDPRMLKVNKDGTVETIGSGWPEIEDVPNTYIHNDLEADFDNDGRMDRFFGGSIGMTVWTSESAYTFSKYPVTYGGEPYLNSDFLDALDHKIADFDGDGRPDVIALRSAPGDASDLRVYLWRNISTADDMANKTIKFDAAVQVHEAWETNMGSYIAHMALMEVRDVNGDGRADILYAGNRLEVQEGGFFVNTTVGGAVTFDAQSLNTMGIPDSELYADALGRTPAHVWADVNGDGMDDWVLKPRDDNTWRVRFNLGNGFGSSLSTGYNGGNGNPQAARPGDIDNDGRMELLVPVFRLATGCMGSMVVQDQEGEWVPMDLCGNQMDAQVPGTGEYDMSIYRFNAVRIIDVPGSGISHEVISGIEFAAPLKGFISQDINGDGLNDVVWDASHRGGYQGYYADPEISWNWQCGTEDQHCLYKLPSYGVYASVAKQGVPDLLTGVTDGLARQSQWTYYPLTETDINKTDGRPLYTLPYGRGNYDATPDNQQIDNDGYYYTSTMYVVSEFRQSTGLGSALDRTTYSYWEAVNDPDGRGMLGFSKILVRDPERGTSTTTTYELRFPQTGSPLTVTTTIDGHATPISVSSSTYSTLVLDAAPTPDLVQSVLTSGSKVTNELTGGTYTSTTTSTPTYDARGCATGGTTTTTDPFGTYTSQETVGVAFDMTLGSAWWPCKVVSKTTTKSVSYLERPDHLASSDSKTLVTSVVYNGRRQPTSETIGPSPADAALTRTTTYAYIETQGAADFGNLRLTTISGGSGATALPVARWTSTTWSSDGYFPAQVMNVMSQAVTTVTDPASGQPTQVTDPNGVDSYATYDAFGRKATAWTETLPVQTTTYSLCSGCGVANASYSVQVSQPGAPTGVTYYDKLNRAIRSVSVGFDGVSVIKDTEYDALGRAWRSSEPYKNGATVHWNSTTLFDAVDRSRTTVDGKGQTVNFTFDGPTVTATTVVGGLNQVTTTEKNAAGQLLTSIDANGKKTHFRYDALGNPIRIEDAIGAVITTTYNAIGQKTALVDPDLGSWLYTYNIVGEKLSERDGRGQWSYFTYDNLGRMKTRTEPGASGQCVSTWNYDTASAGVGKLASVVGCDGFVETYAYDALGRSSGVTTTLGTGGSTQTVNTTYDAYGRVDIVWYPETQTGSAAPQNVAATPTYSETGQITISWSAPTAGGTVTGYKVYKRMSGNSSWGTAVSLGASVYSHTYNSLVTSDWEFKVAACVNTLCTDSAIVYAEVNREGGGGGFKPGTGVDGPLGAMASAAGRDRVFGTGDQRRAKKPKNAPIVMQSLGQPRFGVQHIYNAQGYLWQVKNATGGTIYWTANNLNAYGMVESETAGNGLTTNRAFYAGAPFITSIQTGGNAQSLTYQWNPAGQLLNRSSATVGTSETFTYDELNRVLTGSLTYSGGTVQTLGVTYNWVGNITNKLGVGDYAYPAPTAARPHAVTAAGSQTFVYDANGNMTQRNGGTITWDAGNMPTSINSGSNYSNFSYSPSRARYKEYSKYGSRFETTWFIGGIWEKFTNSALARDEYRYRILAYGAPVAQVTQYSTSGMGDQTVYLHRDHLGSVDTITSSAGAVLQRMSFDAHGKRRDASTWATTYDYTTHASTIDALRGTTPRGFTDHEMLDNVGLVHMNGRVYDPTIGRFLSVDPVFQFPENTQSLNPYTYVLNTPLTLTDPTGHMSDGGWDGMAFFAKMGKSAAETSMIMRKAKSPNAMFAQYLKEMNEDPSMVGMPGGDNLLLNAIEFHGLAGDSASMADAFFSGPVTSAADKETRRYLTPAERNAAFNDMTKAAATLSNTDDYKNGYKSEEGAATAWANAFNPISIKHDVELGSRIFTNGAQGNKERFYSGSVITDFHTSKIAESTYLNSKAPLTGLRMTAFIHTHGASTRESSNDFSGSDLTRTTVNAAHGDPFAAGGDLYVAWRNGKNIYVATPSGQLKKWDYKAFEKGWTRDERLSSYVSEVSNQISR